MTRILRANRYFIPAAALLFAVSSLSASPTQQAGSDDRNFSSSLVVAPLAKGPRFVRFPDGREQLTYTIEAEYPAEAVLSFINERLKKLNWKSLPEDFLNPGIPASQERGWTFFEDQTQKSKTFVWQWASDWENGSHDISSYSLSYQSSDNSTRNLKDLHLMALYIPADVANKMRHPRMK